MQISLEQELGMLLANARTEFPKTHGATTSELETELLAFAQEHANDDDFKNDAVRFFYTTLKYLIRSSQKESTLEEYFVYLEFFISVLLVQVCQSLNVLQDSEVASYVEIFSGHRMAQGFERVIQHRQSEQPIWKSIKVALDTPKKEGAHD
jgi:hypothetical protein